MLLQTLLFGFLNECGCQVVDGNLRTMIGNMFWKRKVDVLVASECDNYEREGLSRILVCKWAKVMSVGR